MLANNASNMLEKDNNIDNITLNHANMFSLFQLMLEYI